MTQYHESNYSFVLSDTSGNEQWQLLQAKLRTYNLAVSTVRGPETIPLNINVIDERGNLVGGLAAFTYWRWLRIELLVLDENLRGQGLGRRLMMMAEDTARSRGCLRAYTSTYDFQALGFYQKFGYFIVGRLEDYPDGYILYWLRKDFADVDQKEGMSQ